MICLGIESTAHTFGVGIVDEKGRILADSRDVFLPPAGWGIKPIEAKEHHLRVKDFVLENALKEVSGDYRKIHVVTSAIEHSSVLEVCREIEKRGGRVSYIPVDAHGRILIAELKKQLTPQTTLVSVMLANNEIGTLQPISEIGKAIRKVRKEKHSLYPYMHVDAAQAPVYVPVHVPQLGIDLLSIDGHKIYGPQGVGLLYMRRGVAIEPRFYGGGQEGGHRSGTEPLALVIGMAEALEIAEDEREKNVRKMRLLHNYFVERLHARLSETVLNGDEKEGLPNIVNVSIPETESDFLVIALDERGIACASRSACHAQDDSSYVVSALKKGREIADGTVRFSMLTTTTKKEIKYVVSMLEEAVAEAKRARAIVNEQRLH